MRSETELRAALIQAQDVLTEAEIDYRQQRFLTDDELRAFMVEQASREKASIRRAVDADHIYVVAGSDVRRVHFWDCSSLREQIDRDRAWSFWLHGDPENFRKELAHGDGGPRMPLLLDRDAVESLPTYVTCQICSPTLGHTKKARGERTTKLTSLVARHIGRSLTALDGSPLGELQRIVTTVDAHGSTVLVETTTQSFTDKERLAIVVAPVGS